MKPIIKLRRVIFLIGLSALVTSCVTTRSGESGGSYSSYASRVPSHIDTNEKTIVVDPRLHVWAAYNSNGDIVNSGLASAGSSWCSDLGKPCHTSTGTFRIQSLGGPDCVSSLFPLGIGGSPMPYCMFFHDGQALHGVPPNEIGEGNYSHGCVRLHVSDAEWIRFNFAETGTKIIIRPY